MSETGRLQLNLTSEVAPDAVERRQTSLSFTQADRDAARARASSSISREASEQASQRQAMQVQRQAKASA